MNPRRETEATPSADSDLPEGCPVEYQGRWVEEGRVRLFYFVFWKGVGTFVGNPAALFADDAGLNYLTFSGFVDRRIICEPVFFFMIWKPIPGTNGKYEVSACGQIKSVFGVSKLGKIKPTGTVLKQSINHRGYKIIKLLLWFENGSRVRKTRKVHRIVCEAFHLNPESKPQVNHKDLNQLNNHESNLEWATAKENTNHAQANGRMPIAEPYIKKGRKGGFHKPIIDIQTGIFYTSDELAFILDISRKEICRMINEERKPNTSQYRYA